MWNEWISCEQSLEFCTFSDESSIELDCTSGHQRFLIKRTQRYDPEYVRGARQSGGGKLMIWSYIINDTMDAALYKQILIKTVLPLCKKHLRETGEIMTFQDDGGSSHDANEIIDYAADVGIERINWPARSPDMNPIEYVWGWIKMNLSKRKGKPKNKEELKEAIIEEWLKITPQSIQNLFKGMTKR